MYIYLYIYIYTYIYLVYMYRKTRLFLVPAFAASAALGALISGTRLIAASQVCCCVWCNVRCSACCSLLPCALISSARPIAAS